MGDVVLFPTPLPLMSAPQDNGALQDDLNQIIRYINTIAYGSNIGTQALLKANNLGDLNNVVTARANLGLGSAAVLSSTAFDAAGAAAAVQAASLQKSQNLGDLNNAATARTNLGLGSAATQSSTSFDPAGAAASRASAGINGDITALTALSVLTNLTTSRNVIVGNSLLEVNAASGAVTVTYSPAVSAGRVTIVKTDNTYNPVNISNGSSVVYSLIAPSVNGYCQAATAYPSGGTLRVIS